jgi:hypothetical protein
LQQRFDELEKDQ